MQNPPSDQVKILKMDPNSSFPLRYALFLRQYAFHSTHTRETCKPPFCTPSGCSKSELCGAYPSHNPGLFPVGIRAQRFSLPGCLRARLSSCPSVYMPICLRARRAHASERRMCITVGAAPAGRRTYGSKCPHILRLKGGTSYTTPLEVVGF